MEEQKPKVYVGGLFVFVHKIIKSINDIQFLLMRKVEETEGGKEKTGFYKSIGIDDFNCIDKHGDSCIDTKEDFLEYLYWNLVVKYMFDPEVANTIMKKERYSERSYEERMLIIAFVRKARIYPLSFERSLCKREQGIDRTIFFVSKVLNQKGQIITNPRLLKTHIPGEDEGLQREFTSFNTEDACNHLFQKNNVNAAAFLGVQTIGELVINSKYNNKKSSPDDKAKARNIINDFHNLISDIKI